MKRRRWALVAWPSHSCASHSTVTVRRGQVIAAIGNSGDAREPYLHFQVTNGPGILASEGLPYVIDRFRMKLPEGSWQERRNEFPLGNAIIEFDGR